MKQASSKETVEEIVDDFIRFVSTDYFLTLGGGGIPVNIRPTTFKQVKSAIEEEFINNDEYSTQIKIAILTVLKEKFIEYDEGYYPMSDSGDFLDTDEQIKRHRLATHITNFIAEKIKELKNKNIKPPISRNLTFHWLGKPHQLAILHTIIQRPPKLIDKIPFNEFNIIFSKNPQPQPIKKAIKRIRWIDTAIRTKKSNLRSLFEFLYFLKKQKYLPDTDFITREHTNHLYSKIRNCFEDKEGKTFKNLSGCNPFRKIKETEEIDKYKYPQNITKIQDCLTPTFPQSKG